MEVSSDSRSKKGMNTRLEKYDAMYMTYAKKLITNLYRGIQAWIQFATTANSHAAPILNIMLTRTDTGEAASA